MMKLTMALGGKTVEITFGLKTTKVSAIISNGINTYRSSMIFPRCLSPSPRIYPTTDITANDFV